MNIEERISMLDKYDYPVNIFSRIIRDFIDDKTEIKPVLIRKGFYLDDISLYKEAISNISEHDSNITIFCKIIHYIMDKFGVICSKENRWKVLNLDYKDEYGFEHPVSIREFVGKNAAMCFERATFLHNNLKILDFESAVIVGKLYSNDGEEYHAYNLVITEDSKYVLLDSTNFMLGIKDKKAYPCIFTLTKEEYKGIVYGNSKFRASKEKNPLIVEFMDFDLMYC